jgi:hypothetical protein
MKGNGTRINAARGPVPSSVSRWSTGRIELEAPGHEMVVGAIELFRIGLLVHVVARFDTTDKAYLASELFPMVLSTVELFPSASIHPEPMTELGEQVTRGMLQTVQSELQAWEAKRSAVDKAMAELAAAPEGDEALQEKPPGVS